MFHRGILLCEPEDIIMLKVQLLIKICRALPDPFRYHEPSSPQSIDFYGYGPRISRSDAFNCIKGANHDSWSHAGDESMVIEPKGSL